MITSATAFLSEMADSDICFVKVVECVEKSSDITKFKTVSVVEEIGYWLRTFHFNIFANHCLYDDIQEGMSLKVKVIFKEVVKNSVFVYKIPFSFIKILFSLYL